ncbi:ABC transporter ATP-binding protein [Paenimyroides baculatum]|uniref:ABC transporter ATP-binding protein n=1 Tax=Paenimyroides baculatum TaxID=2608000 RepID=A0A5M6CYN9_9FLAO|nr:ABC transporter ATP-binding protein [Paenimyroides baculatum]KAA5538409.1 ABC transporter ATP-binding protein [Paenimyroides baculatum]
MLQVNQLSFSYNNSQVLNDVSFQLKAGNSYALIGASGSGKSTLLKLVYGLLDADSGSIFWNEKQILGPAYHLVSGMDYMKYLAQDFDLMPFVSVAENVGRFLSNFYLKEKKNRVDELLKLVDMTEFANIKAKFLSGGQMQRTALARVLALEPEFLLLDEPFSHIDPFQKRKLATQLFQYCKQKGITILFTSHTPEEALMYADGILVLQNGNLIEKDTPQNIYENTKNEYIARLTGDVNIIPASYLGLNGNGVLYVRPHELQISNDGFEVQIKHSYFTGKNYLIYAVLNDLEICFEHKTALQSNERVFISLLKQ